MFLRDGLLWALKAADSSSITDITQAIEKQQSGVGKKASPLKRLPSWYSGF